MPETNPQVPVSWRRPKPNAPACFALVALSAWLAFAACDKEPPPAPSADPSATTAPSQSAPLTNAAQGNPERGLALMKEFECNRCHDGTGHEPVKLEMHCIDCHRDIMSGKFKAPAADLAKWRKNVEHYWDAPSFAGSAKRYRADWLVGFLKQPHDLRPGLVQTMPRLAISDEQARDLAAHLTRGAKAAPGDAFEGANLSKGRELMEQKGCPTCHVMSGVPAFLTKPEPASADENTRRGISLAPDLRGTRERLPPEHAVAWIRDPRSINKDTLMPTTSLSLAEARDIAAYIFKAELEPFKPKAVPARLPKLERQVGYEEVAEKVFGRTCVHCHANADVARGDGGPGNTGGFGFKPRKLNLSSYSSIMSGLLDASGERMSVFAPTADGTPRIVAALLARQAEEAGAPSKEVRGMPLSLPALSAEQIQLVETWVAQGRPR